MHKAVAGAKAGLIPSIIVSILGSLLGNYYTLAIKYREELSTALGRPYAPTLQDLTFAAVSTIIILTICGILYALLYERLPSKRSFWKVFPFGLAVFIFSRVGDLIVDYPLSPGLVIDNALLSAPLLLLLYPYLAGKLYAPKGYGNSGNKTF